MVPLSDSTENTFPRENNETEILKPVENYAYDYYSTYAMNPAIRINVASPMPSMESSSWSSHWKAISMTVTSVVDETEVAPEASEVVVVVVVVVDFLVSSRETKIMKKCHKISF